MNMTVVKLTKLDACPEGIQYFKEHKFKTVEQAITEILKTDHSQRLNWSNWLISRSLSKMSKENCIRYAVYAAEQVIGIFEKKYPKDKRPRKAIQAAKRYLKNPTEENKEKCKAAASSAYAYAASWAAAWAAFAASDAAATCAAASWAARAASSAYAAWAYTAAKDKTFEKIIKYGLKLLKGV
jgi:hypothetical protein